MLCKHFNTFGECKWQTTYKVFFSCYLFEVNQMAPNSLSHEGTCLSVAEVLWPKSNWGCKRRERIDCRFLSSCFKKQSTRWRMSQTVWKSKTKTDRLRLREWGRWGGGGVSVTNIMGSIWYLLYVVQLYVLVRKKIQTFKPQVNLDTFCSVLPP